MKNSRSIPTCFWMTIITTVLWIDGHRADRTDPPPPHAQFPLTAAHGGSDVRCHFPDVLLHQPPQWGPGPREQKAGALQLGQSMGAYVHNSPTHRLISLNARSESMFFYVNIKDEGIVMDLCAIKFYAAIDHWKHERRLYLKTRVTACSYDGMAHLIQKDRWYHVGFTFEAGSRTLRVYVDGREHLQHALSAHAAARVFPYISLGGPLLTCAFCPLHGGRPLQSHAGTHALITALTFFSSCLSPSDVAAVMGECRVTLWRYAPTWPRCLPLIQPGNTKHAGNSVETGAGRNTLDSRFLILIIACVTATVLLLGYTLHKVVTGCGKKMHLPESALLYRRLVSGASSPRSGDDHRCEHAVAYSAAPINGGWLNDFAAVAPETIEHPPTYEDCEDHPGATSRETVGHHG